MVEKWLIFEKKKKKLKINRSQQVLTHLRSSVWTDDFTPIWFYFRQNEWTRASRAYDFNGKKKSQNVYNWVKSQINCCHSLTYVTFEIDTITLLKPPGDRLKVGLLSKLSYFSQIKTQSENEIEIEFEHKHKETVKKWMLPTVYGHQKYVYIFSSFCFFFLKSKLAIISEMRAM